MATLEEVLQRTEFSQMNGARIDRTSHISELHALPETSAFSRTLVLEHESGEYLVLGQAGRGMHGRVFKAYNLATEEFVAIKVDAPTELGMQLRRKRNNTTSDIARAEAGKFQYVENILPRRDYWDSIGNQFIVMPYVDTFLSDVFEHNGQRQYLGNGITAQTITKYARDMLNGLAQMHTHWRVAHRDIKLSNCALANGRVLLTDFGVSSSGMTISPRDNIGWIYVRPPENFNRVSQANPANWARFDLWMLGANIYRMCTGKLPFEEEFDSLAKKDGVNDLDASPRIRKYIDYINFGEMFEESPWKNGDKILQRKINARHWYGAKKIPRQLRVLVSELLRIDPTQRPKDAAAALAEWEHTQREDKQFRKFIAGTAALPALVTGLIVGGNAISESAKNSDPAYVEFKKNQETYEVAQPVEMRNAVRELFIDQLGRGYRNAVVQNLINAKLTPTDCPLEKVVCTQKQLEAAIPPFHKQAYTDRYGKLETYEMIRNYFVNEALQSLEYYMYIPSYRENVDMFILGSMIGQQRFRNLAESYEPIAAKDPMLSVQLRTAKVDYEKNRILRKGAIHKLNEDFRRTPGQFISKEQQKFFKDWKEGFTWADPLGYGQMARGSDQRVR